MKLNPLYSILIGLISAHETSSAESPANDTFIAGDVIADGCFNISDLVLMQKWLLAVPDTELKSPKAGDLCEDGILDVFDLCVMSKMLIK